MKLKELKRYKSYPLLIFFARLLILSIPLYLIIFFGNLYQLQNMVAGNSETVLELIGFNVSRDGPMMQTDNFRFFISKDSTGWKSMLFFSALIIAVPGVIWKKRLIGIALGVSVIYIGNLGRVVSIVVTNAAFGYDAAMIIHDWGWRFGLVTLVLVLWLIWLRWTKINRNKK